MSLRYRELAPPPDLAPFVACFWSLASDGAPHRVLPDGCSDLIFDVGSGAEPFVVGAMTGAVLTEAAAPSTFVGVRFRPGGALPFFRVSARELRDQRLAVGEVVPPALRDVAYRASDSPTAEGAMLSLATGLERLTAGAVRPDVRLRRALAVLEAADGRVTVARLAADLRTSERHLERLFDEHVGLGPKAYARVVRMRRVVACLDGGEEPRWARVAAELGYTDQSHLVRELRALTGLAPRELWRERRVGFVQGSTGATEYGSSGEGAPDHD